MSVVFFSYFAASLWIFCISLYHLLLRCVCLLVDAVLLSWPSDLHRCRVTLSEILCAVAVQFSALCSLFQCLVSSQWCHKNHHSLVLVVTARFSNGFIV